ncbi:MAG: sugar ABC transporter ATP-binding protein, partial [Oscillochloris sp.]|nr:sugar ABC transporter ATP-binding protein [Oscillochloris sp.]
MMATRQTQPPPTRLQADQVVLRAEQVSKIFGATVALNQVDFNVYQGKVNVLIGENGAGKSTLMKILAGVDLPTDGQLLLDGQEIHFNSTREAAARGIGIIYQELNLFPNLSVTENIFMAREQTAYGVLIDGRAQEEVARELMQRLEQPIDPRTPVGDLSLGQQQIVEIAKALAQSVRILIMDEPTSALSTTEVAVLFRIIRELKAQGVSIIYISHKLDELLQIGDYVTVLRDGRLVAESPATNVTVSWIISQMVGQERGSTVRQREHALGTELLRVENMSLEKASGGLLLDSLSFSLRAGEIVGVYGLMGAGRTELCECLIGLHPQVHGTIWLNGTLLRARAIKDRISAGLVLVPEDRQRAGLVQSLSVASNITLASLGRYAQRVLLSPAAER